MTNFVESSKYAFFPPAIKRQTSFVPFASNMYQGVGIINGIGVSGDKEGWDQNYFMYQGESITYEGIKISLLSTSDNDTIRIEKTS